MPPQGTLTSPQWIDWTQGGVPGSPGTPKLCPCSCGSGQVLCIVLNQLGSFSSVRNYAKPHHFCKATAAVEKRQVSGHQVSRGAAAEQRVNLQARRCPDILRSQGSALPSIPQWNPGSCRRHCPSCRLRDRTHTASVDGSTHRDISAQSSFQPLTWAAAPSSCWQQTKPKTWKQES